jgi:hypothetical protein
MAAVDPVTAVFRRRTVATHAIGRAQYAAHMTHAVARAVSILGHPMLVLPLVMLALSAGTGRTGDALWMGLGFVVFAAVVMAYSKHKVMRGQWTHVDASNHDERKSLNRFLLLALLVSAVLSVATGMPRELAWGLALSAAMVAVAMLTARWCKLSLHMAFVVFAVFLLGTASWWAALAGAAFAAAVAWSRLRLQRHVLRDLVAGAGTGAFAGMAYLLANPGMAS